MHCNSIHALAFIVLFLPTIVMPAFAEQRVFDGKTFTIVTNAKDFVKGYQKGIPTMIKFMGSDFKNTNIKIMEYTESVGLQPSLVYSPSRVIYSKNNRVLSMAESMKLLGMMSNKNIIIGNNSGAQVEDFENDIFLMPANFQTSKITLGDVNNIKKYFKYLAGLWWRNNNGEKICDRCNAVVPYQSGYIYGMIESNYLKAHSLLCENCMNRMINDPKLLINLQNNSNYMGNGLIDKVREYVNSSR